MSAPPPPAPEERLARPADVPDADSGMDLVTVVVPARDEELSIGSCLDSILAQDHRHLQVVVVDNGSRDRTGQVVRGYAARDARVELLHNSRGGISASLNVGLAAARGVWLVRVDAHSTVPPNYVRIAVDHLRHGSWGGVGGRKDAVGLTPAGRAIAVAMGSRFGVGGSTYHHGTAPQVVDHVPFGAYPTALAREVGGWDVDLSANEDYEFDYRLRRRGHQLLFDPALRIDWRCRQSVPDLFRQYRRYGSGKARVVVLHPGATSPRHLVGAGLVAWLLAAAALSVRRPLAGLAAVAPYAAGVAVASAVTVPAVDPDARRWLPAAFVAMHTGYGAGFWQGLAQALRERRG